MKDMLPREMEIRDYLIGLIKETYKTYGFCSIETPCVEHIENLCSKQGGDNEKLIFKILKRGEKLKIDTAKEENDLVDGGLRYDLTVPLARYYANHSNELPAPFKALQIGNVWRADRPQKGRFRQFMQCDIDILGEPGNLAEIELILATTAMLGKLSFQNFTVCINDRNILKAMAAYSGFREEDYDEVFIILDKMDKIGAEGVAKELEEMGKKAGFSHVALLKSDSIQLMPEVREMCKNNTCHMYAKRWSCPPGCGDLEVCRKKIEKYREGIIVQTVGKLDDPLDGETMMETEAVHIQNFYEFEKVLRERWPGMLPIGAGCCTKCKTCTYPDAPCRFPEQAFSSMEAYGMLVTQVCQANGLEYYYGPCTIAYTSCYLLE